MSREVKVFKLTNGDEIVAYTSEVMEGLGKSFKLEKPRAMQIVPTRDGPQAGLVPWVIAVPDCTITLRQDQFFVMVDAPKEVEDYYMEITSSIKLASSLN